jgi:hypothetical protein
LGPSGYGLLIGQGIARLAGGREREEGGVGRWKKIDPTRKEIRIFFKKAFSISGFDSNSSLIQNLTNSTRSYNLKHTNQSKTDEGDKDATNKHITT